MPVDASIALGLKPLQIDNPTNALAQIMHIQGLQQQNQLGALQLQQHQQAAQEDAATREVYKGFGEDAQANTAALYKAGLGKQGLAYEAAMEKIRSGRAAAQEQSAKATQAQLGVYRDVAGLADKPQDFATLIQQMEKDPLTASVVQSLGGAQAAIARIPSDPTAFQDYKNKFSLGIKEYTENYTKMRGQDMTAQTAANSELGKNARNTQTAQATVLASGIDPGSLPALGGAPAATAPPVGARPLGMVPPTAPSMPRQAVAQPGMPAGPNQIPPAVQAGADAEAGKLMIVNEFGGDVNRAKAELASMRDGIARAPRGKNSNDAIVMLQSQANRLQAGISAMEGNAAPAPGGLRLLPEMMGKVDSIGRGDLTMEEGTRRMTPAVAGMVEQAVRDKYPEFSNKDAKLKPIPPSVNTAILANRQASNQLDRALTLIQGKNIGDPANGGMQGDAAATGWKGLVPQALLNRADPKGVSARAEIADVGSMKIHDRSGAAVTVGEFPRLMPFIPSATDDQPTVIKKLQRLKLEIDNMTEGLGETYSKEQGYRPSPILTRPAAQTAPPATPRKFTYLGKAD